MPMDVRRLVAPTRTEAAAAKTERPMADSLRMTVFLELVLAQDEGLTVARSRGRVAGKYKLTTDQVLAIESEGLAKSWAPL